MDLSLIIDIESGHVRAALAVLKLSKENEGIGTPRHILYSVSVPISRTPHTVHEHLLIEMGRSLSKAVETAFKEGLRKIPKGKITSIHYVLSSPWIVTKTRCVKVNYPKKTAVTKKTIEKIVEAERIELQNAFIPNDVAGMVYDLTCIEQKIFEIKLDGYPVVHLAATNAGKTKPSSKHIPKKASELEVSFAVTMSSVGIVNQVQAIVEKVVRVKDQAFHSALLLLFASVRNVFDDAKDYIVAHVHGEVSDIILVNNNIYSLIASFPFGTSTFLRKSSQATDESERLMQSMLALHTSSSLHGDHHEKVSKAIDPVVRSWSRDLMSTISGARAGKSPFPNTIFLFAKDYHSHFERALRDVAGSMKLDIVPFKYETLLDMYALALEQIQHHE